MAHKSRKAEAAQSAHAAQSRPTEASKHASPESRPKRKDQSKKDKREVPAQLQTPLSNGVAQAAAGHLLDPAEASESKAKDKKKKRKHRETEDTPLDDVPLSNGESKSHVDVKLAPSEESKSEAKHDKKKRKHSDDDDKRSSKKLKKQKNATPVEDVFIPLESAADPTLAADAPEEAIKKSKKHKSSKPAVASLAPSESLTVSGTVEPRSKAEKKVKKTKRKLEDSAENTSKSEKSKKHKKSSKPEDTLPTPSEHSEEAMSTVNDDPDAVVSTGKKARFIVFVGNLPFSTTTASLTEHFAKIHPDSIRHITLKSGEVDTTLAKKVSKSTKKVSGGDAAEPRSKGFAFLEFDSYDRMRTCLKLYHHSVFEDRKINVELTAGGGGKKSEGRKEKLKLKNERLNGQRKRKSEEEAKAKAEKGSKRIEGNDHEDGQGEIHPSRRAQIPESR